MLKTIRCIYLHETFIESDIFNGGKNPEILFQMNKTSISLDIYVWGFDHLSKGLQCTDGQCSRSIILLQYRNTLKL